jgi:murein DD-endopeptidase MepM/ murein hydrolase activator NlpD
MGFRLGSKGTLTALILFTSLGSASAYAQQSQSPTDDVPSFKQDAIDASKYVKTRPAEAQKAPVVLQPLAPPVVVEAGPGIPSGPAQVVPPAPKIVARSAGVFVIPPKSFGSPGFSAQTAALASPLKVNSNFGYRRDPFTRRGRMHTGVDIDGDYGQSVGSPLNGTVSFAGVKRGYGNIVIVDHGGGISTYYAHLSSIAVAVGDGVASGQVIGMIGSTGRSTGPHLHYEVRANGHPVNPFATIAFEAGQVLVDGRPLSMGPVEEWGDDPIAAAAPAQASAANVAGTRPRRTNTTPQKTVDKHVLVYGEDSLTEY